MAVYGNAVGGFSTPRTLVLTDVDGNEFVGAVVGERTIFTANADTDIREGVVAATDAGVVTGSAIIPNYETCTGKKVVKSGGQFEIVLTLHDLYDYTGLQCIICPFNSSVDNSVSAEMVVIGDNVYNSNSAEVAAIVNKNADSKSISLNLINTTEVPYIIRYFTYKKLYGK